MRPTTRDLVSVAVFVLLLIVLVGVFVAAALPAGHA
jgi:hypothetical protein